MRAIPIPPAVDVEARSALPRLRRLCGLLLADPDEGDDVAQDVLLRFVETAPTETRAIDWPRWLTRVAVNACHDRRRSGWWRWWRRAGVEIAADVAAPGRTPEAAAAAAEQHAAMWRVLARLPARQREVFVLRQLEHWSTQEVADALGCTTGTVKQHLFRAVQALRAALEAHR